MAKVAEVLVQTLIEAGVKRVYGVAGDSLNGMTETIRKSDKIEWLHVRHEEVAAFAAGAEAHLTNEIAVCAGSCGPGNLHHCTYDQFVCTYDQVIEKGRCYGNVVRHG